MLTWHPTGRATRLYAATDGRNPVLATQQQIHCRAAPQSGLFTASQGLEVGAAHDLLLDGSTAVKIYHQECVEVLATRRPGGALEAWRTERLEPGANERVETLAVRKLQRHVGTVQTVVHAE